MRSASRVSFNKSEKGWLFVLGCLAVAGFGLFWMTTGSFALIEAALSAKWPVTDGHITESMIESGAPVVMYSYTVEGHSYTGNRISPGLGVESLDLAQLIISRYPKGSVHNVYYRPSDPSDAYLEPCTLFNLLLGSLLFTFGSFGVAESYLIPKYGKRRPDGKTYALPGSHPLSKAFHIAMLLMGLEFAALVYLCYQGYVAK